MRTWTCTFPLLLLYAALISAYDGKTCCEQAKRDGAFVGPVPAYENQTCGQTYHESLEPAAPLYVPFRYCDKECGGMDLHLFNETSAWTAPLVQFILPSIIFSMTVPRQKKIEVDYLFDFPRLSGFWRLVISMGLFWLILIPVIVDTLVWISTIVVAAGDMLVGGIYEAHIDYRILRHVLSRATETDEQDMEGKRQLLVTIASGNLELDSGHPQEAIPAAIIVSDSPDPAVGHEMARSRLLNLLGAQSSFGGAVGSPVLFYLGAFVYSILELLNDPSSQPAAISLGFGIEWMIIVHVAIVSGCLLASNNPSTSSGIAGSRHLGLRRHSRPHVNRVNTLDPIPATSRQTNASRSIWSWTRFRRAIHGWFRAPSFQTRFQPVSLHARGTNKMRWVKRSNAWIADENATGIRHEMNITPWGWILKVWAPCMLLIVVPPATGGIVAYFTPPKGVGCRSLSFILYAVSQVGLVTLSTIHTAIENAQQTRREERERSKFVQLLKKFLITPLRRVLRPFFTGCLYTVLLTLFYFIALASAVGGTTMQIVGVYNNCVCYAGSENWYNPLKANPMVNLASDTDLARKASVYWIWMGGTAAIFMAVNAYVGWWYQRVVRRRFEDAVRGMSSGAEESEDSGDDGNDSGDQAIVNPSARLLNGRSSSGNQRVYRLQRPTPGPGLPGESHQMYGGLGQGDRSNNEGRTGMITRSVVAMDEGEDGDVSLSTSSRRGGRAAGGNPGNNMYGRATGASIAGSGRGARQGSGRGRGSGVWEDVELHAVQQRTSWPRRRGGGGDDTN